MNTVPSIVGLIGAVAGALEARRAAWALGVLCVAGCAGSSHTPAPARDAPLPRYLAFQMFSYGPGADASLLFSGVPVEEDVDELLERLGGETGGDDRRLAFAVGPFTFDQPDDAWRRDIEEGFRIARERDIAVVFHIDDSMMWSARTDLTSVPDNVEWSDWDGTPHPARVIGWLPGVTLAPPMCYESPAIRAEVSRIVHDVVGPAVARGLDALRAEAREHLFAGVIAGWETRLDDDRQPPRSFGYCSLTHRGYGAASPPADIDTELEDVVQRWASHWAEQLGLAGVPEELIYTHMALFEGQVHAPPRTAFNDHGQAGFSAYGPSLLDVVDGRLANELEARGNPRWAMAEGTNLSLGDPFAGGGSDSGVTWEKYLGTLLEANASLVNIFAWQERSPDGTYGPATRSDEALDAYLRFLHGEELPGLTADDVERLRGRDTIAPGPASPHDPTDLTVVSTSSSRVDLQWTNNATDAMAFIVQRCSGSLCTDFANVTARPAAEGTTATDTGVLSGATYRYRVFAARSAGFSGASNVVDASAE